MHNATALVQNCQIADQPINLIYTLRNIIRMLLCFYRVAAYLRSR